MTAPLGWLGIVRLGLVQAALGAVVVLVTATVNRVMVVELALPSIVPGLLVGLHYGVQILRPRLGHGTDATGRRTPWILGGMAVLAASGVGAALAVAAMPVHPLLGLAMAAVAYAGVGLGVGAAGTALLALAATRVEPGKRAVAAPVMWITMIAGFAVTAGIAGACLDPFSLGRLVEVVSTACAAAFLLAVSALWRLEGDAPAVWANPVSTPTPRFGDALRQIWSEPTVRSFTLFVFVSMLAYSAEDLVIEPFAGIVLQLPPGGTTALSGLQHGGALCGMLTVALLAVTIGRRRVGLMAPLAVAGCVMSAGVLGGLAVAAFAAAEPPLRPAVVLLGFGNGVFAVAAVGAMMGLATRGTGSRSGLRMGVWGAAQAAAFGLGSIVGPALVDGARLVLARPAAAYGLVLAAEALLFVAAAGLARRVVVPAHATARATGAMAAEAT